MAKVSLRAYDREIETMIDRGQFDEAIAHCRHILKTYPKHLETYRLLGKAYLESKRYGDAMDIFSRILATVPNDFVAQVGMSIIRDEENQLDDAIWHMERAFETQPSNPAIQGELQRLYARRDGVRPPRIRMTRGALANMYVQGELYPQAISEIRNVLKDDPERADMLALLARACYRSGLKNEAADVASSLLRRYPYSLDANRVLVEILGSDHPETTQLYRQRVFELDPYAAHVTGNVFNSGEVSDAAVNVERLDWNGQPVILPVDWSESRAISPETGEQTDWLGSEPSGFGGIQSEPTSIFGAPSPAPEPPSPFSGIQNDPANIFGSSTPAEQPPAQADEEEIPDFLRAAGWGAATGAFDESKSAFAEEEPKSGESIEQGDLPDWVRAMKPPETQAPAQEQEQEELPDWIKNIGMGAIAAQAFDRDQKESPSEAQAPGVEDATQWLSAVESKPAAAPGDDLSSEFSWLKDLDETGSAPASQAEEPDWLKSAGFTETPGAGQSEEPDWLKGLGQAEVPEETKSDEPEWMKTLGVSEEAATPLTSDEPDWLKGLGETQPSAPVAETGDDQDWLRDLGTTEPTAAPFAAQEEQPDWLKSLGDTQPSAARAPAEDLDWLKDLGTPEEPSKPAEEEEPDWLRGLGEPESMPSQGRDDQPDWLKGLALAGGAAAISHLAQDDESEEKVDETASMPEASGGESNFLDQLSEEPILQTPPAAPGPQVDVEKLGTSEQEQDDSFAWLESLAAKQGATEGLLTTPEERLDEEPEWVKQAKGLTGETPVSQTPAEQLPVNVEDLGKSEQEQDDSFAWLESLAARQGATEGLLTTPEERLDEEPEWVKQARDLSAPEPAPAVLPEPEPAMQEPVALTEPEPAPVDEVEAWLKNLEGEEPSVEPASAVDETAIWLQGLEEKEAPPQEEAVEPAGSELPEWMQNVQVGPDEKPASIFTEEAELGATWMPPTEEPAPLPEAKAEEEGLPSWLSELDEEKEQVSTPAEADDLPAWLLEEETAPAVPERVTFSDWRPTQGPRAEPVLEPPIAEEPAAEIPAVSFEMPEAETVLEPEQPQPEPEAAPVMETPVPAPEARPEPAPRRETGGLAIPTVDPVLATARNELAGNNVPGALDSYGKLIKKARYLDEVIYDLRDALYKYPVDVNLWQSLGDAYMRANRLQDALDAYTKAEELLR